MGKRLRPHSLNLARNQTNYKTKTDEGQFDDGRYSTDVIYGEHDEAIDFVKDMPGRERAAVKQQNSKIKAAISSKECRNMKYFFPIFLSE